MRSRARGWLGWLAWVIGILTSQQAAYAQAPTPLPQLVQPTPGRRSLGAVLLELSRQSRVPFSYSSSLVPLAHRYQVRPGPPRPLSEVLHEVLDAEHLRYGLLAGQLVVWPEHVAAPPGVRPVAPVGAAPASTRQLASLPAKPGVSVPSTATETAADWPPKPLTGSAVRRSKPLLGQPAETKLVAQANRRATREAGSRGKAVPGRLAGTSQFGRRAAAGHWPSGQREAASSAVRRQPTRPLAGKVAIGTRAGHVPQSALSGGAALRPSTQAASGEASRDLELLPARPVRAVVSYPPPPVVVSLAGRGPISALPKDSPAAARLWTGLYLHGEAWVSESLPAGFTGKVGLARAYLVLGVAAGPFDRPAWGVGLGTAGRARGRFTPSLDLLQWFVRGNDSEAVTFTQLRPQLGWQLKREGRLALLVGPTLNLAVTDGRGQQRSSFGQHQWLWLGGEDGRGGARLWPGFQVGLRF